MLLWKTRNTRLISFVFLLFDCSLCTRVWWDNDDGKRSLRDRRLCCSFQFLLHLGLHL